LASIPKKLSHPSAAEAVVEGRTVDADRMEVKALELDTPSRNDL